MIGPRTILGVGRHGGCDVELPIPKHLEDAALPRVPAIIAAAKEVLGGHG